MIIFSLTLLIFYIIINICADSDVCVNHPRGSEETPMASSMQDVEKLFRGSHALDQMWSEISQFRAILMGVLQASLVPDDWVIPIPLYRDERAREHIADVEVRKFQFLLRSRVEGRKIAIDLNKKGEKLLLEEIPVLYAALPRILSVVMFNVPYARRDLEFIMAQADKLNPAPSEG
jgi:hypothetical protein